MTDALPSLIVITDWGLGKDELLGRLRLVASLGPRVAIQHRHPDAPVRAFLDEAKALCELCEREHNPLFVNGRLDVALLVGAHLHLPSKTLLPSDVRPHLPQGTLVSAAVHDEAEADESRGADLVLVSPVFKAGSKPDDARPPIGIEGFERLALRASAPAYALGGITPERAQQLPSAQGFAVISSVLRAPDPRLAALQLLARGHALLA